jgi:hypothetical protein
MKKYPIRWCTRYEISLVPCLLSGCSRAPTFDIAGSLFPGWLVCLVIGIVLAAVTRLRFVRLKVPIVFPIVVYPCLTAFFTFLLWLIFFR